MGLDQRIVSNVQKMVDQKAPPSDIDGYLKQEGLTPEAFKSAVSEPADQPLYKAAGRAVMSSAGSAVKGLGGIASAALQPRQTLRGLGDIGEGVIAKVPGGKSLLTAGGETPEEIARAEQAANALGQDYKNAYGSYARAKETLATDPFRFLTDLSVGAGAAGKAATASKATKLGNVLEKTSEVTNPLYAPTQGISKGTSYAEQFYGKKPQDLANEKAVNATRDATIKQSLDAGYTIPRSAYNPSATTNVLESVGGKAAIGQETAKTNQANTDILARKYLGLPENTAFSKETIESLLKEKAAPYREASLLPAAQIPSTEGGMVRSTQTKTGAQLVNDIKLARDESRGLWEAYNEPGQVNRTEVLNKANVADAKLDDLESKLEQLAKANNKPDLVDEINKARVELAKVHTIEKAMNPATGEINAMNMKQQFNRNKPLTDEAKVIADFANSFPQLAREGSKVPNPDVSGTKAILAAMSAGGGTGAYFGGGMGAAGGALAAAAPFVVPPTAKAIALSKFLQKLPTYEQSTIKKMMKASPKANPLAAALYEMNNATKEEQ